MPGFADLLLILIIAFFIFGASKLPRIATAVGRALVRLRSRSEDGDHDDEE